MKVNRKYILISVIALFIIGGIFLLPNTAWFQNIKQLIFINQVVKQTAEQDAFEIELHVQYDLLGYEMQLQGNGRVQSNTAHFNHIVALNGKGVSPMTLDLEQYIVKNDDTSIMYMSLNEGQWFKETAQPSSTMHNQFLHFNDLSSLHFNKSQLLENNNETQVIQVQTDLSASDSLFQLLIQNIFTLSTDMDLSALVKQAPAAHYEVKIDKNKKLITQYEITYKEGFETILKQLQANYPTQFPSQVMENYNEMFITLSVTLKPLNETELMSIPTDIELQAVEIGTIK